MGRERERDRKREGKRDRERESTHAVKGSPWRALRNSGGLRGVSETARLWGEELEMFKSTSKGPGRVISSIERNVRKQRRSQISPSDEQHVARPASDA